MRFYNCNKSYTFSNKGDFLRVEETSERTGLVFSISNPKVNQMHISTIYLTPEQVVDLSQAIAKYGSELEYKSKKESSIEEKIVQKTDDLEF